MYLTMNDAIEVSARGTCRRSNPVRNSAVVVVDASSALHAQIQLHGAPSDYVARGRLNFGLECGVAVAGSVTELEMPTIDRANLDRDGQSFRLAAGFAKAGHADKQGRALPRIATRRTAYGFSAGEELPLVPEAAGAGSAGPAAPFSAGGAAGDD